MFQIAALQTPISSPVDSGITELLLGPMGGSAALGLLIGIVIGWHACTYVFNNYKVKSLREQIEHLQKELENERTERKKLAEDIRNIHTMLMSKPND